MNESKSSKHSKSRKSSKSSSKSSKCPKDKILNKSTGKCVKKDGRIGKAILSGKYKPKSSKFFSKSHAECEDDEILNPITGKCVKKDGDIGKKIISGDIKLIKYDDCPPGKIRHKSPRGKVSCISVYGKLAQSLISSGKLKLPKKKKEKKEKKEKKKDKEYKESKEGKESDKLDIDWEREIDEYREFKRNKLEKEERKRERKEEKKGDCINESKLPLKPHQIRVVNFMLKKKNRGLLVVHNVGTGKTLTAITTAECLMKKYPDLEIVVITPKSLQKNFQKEMISYGLLPNDKRYYFFTYNEFYINANKLSLEELKDFMKNKLIIIDEVHTIKFKPDLTKKKSGAKDDEEEEGKGESKSAFSQMKAGPKQKAKVSKIFITACKYAKKVLLLTATPVLNRPDELINMIAMIDGTNPVNFFYFIDHIYGYSKKKEFDDYFKCKISIYNPGESKDYPEVIEKTIEFTMPDEFYKKYYKVQQTEISGGEAVINDEVSYKQSLFFTSLRQAINNMNGDKNPKLIWIKNKLLKAMKNGEKTLIYSMFKSTRGYKKAKKKPVVFMDYLIRFLIQNDIPYGLITGDESKNKRNENVNKFNSGEIQVLLISKAGGEGLDLKGTRNVIIVEPYWNQEFVKQVKGRAIRYRSHSHLPYNERYVNVYNLILRKPDKLYADDDMASVDTILYDFSEDKTSRLQKFYNELKDVSIENDDTC